MCFNKRSHLSITSSFLSGCQDKVNDDGSVPYELVKKPAVTWALKIKQILTCRSWKGSRVPLDKSDLAFRELYLKSLIYGRDFAAVVSELSFNSSFYWIRSKQSRKLC